MPEVGGDLPEWVGFRPPSLRVNSYSAYQTYTLTNTNESTLSVCVFTGDVVRLFKCYQNCE